MIKSLQVELCQHLPSPLCSQQQSQGRHTRPDPCRQGEEQRAQQHHFCRLLHPGQLSIKDGSSVLLGVYVEVYCLDKVSMEPSIESKLFLQSRCVSTTRFSLNPLFSGPWTTPLAPLSQHPPLPFTTLFEEQVISCLLLWLPAFTPFSFNK